MEITISPLVIVLVFHIFAVILALITKGIIWWIVAVAFAIAQIALVDNTVLDALFVLLILMYSAHILAEARKG